VHHLKGDRDAAVLHYHAALGINPQDTFTSDMLARALQEFSATPGPEVREAKQIGRR
jgi:hypothetical protein